MCDSCPKSALIENEPGSKLPKSLKPLKLRKTLFINCQQNKYNVDSYTKLLKMNAILTAHSLENLSPGRSKNKDVRSREYLTLNEVNELLTAVGARGRHTERDYALTLLMFRHGLRVSEAIALRWDAVLFDDAKLSISRIKKSKSGVHPLRVDEVEALKGLKDCGYDSQHLFIGERGGPLSRHAVNKMLARAGELAELPLKVHPHMLRHSCGYHLANQGMDTRLIQEWLGHRDIKNTEHYTALNMERFNRIQWD